MSEKPAEQAAATSPSIGRSISDDEVPRHHSELFMLRLWPEEFDAGQVEWRGQVRHVTSGRTRYFREWSTLLAFLQETLLD